MTNPDIASQNRRRAAPLPFFKSGTGIPIEVPRRLLVRLRAVNRFGYIHNIGSNRILTGIRPGSLTRDQPRSAVDATFQAMKRASCRRLPRQQSRQFPGASAQPSPRQGCFSVSPPHLLYIIIAASTQAETREMPVHFLGLKNDRAAALEFRKKLHRESIRLFGI